MKIIYIARKLGAQKNGASQVMARNLNALRTIVGEDNVTVFDLPMPDMRNVAVSLLCKGSYGVTPKIEKRLLVLADKIRPDIVFIESSSFGSIYKKLNQLGLKTVCFAHNVDTQLCAQEIYSRSFIIGWVKYISTRYNERQTCRYADSLICLNERDSKGFFNIFNRRADLILPITFPSKNRIELNEQSTSDAPYFLFVGSDFFPNVEGIKWFIENVAPAVDMRFRIVGTCCYNPAISQLKLPYNVSLVGYADDIDSEYKNAIGVIAPIFKGSGMKTKTIEALSYGKSIFGTSEAFAGIECDFAMVGGLCNSVGEFIEKLRCVKKTDGRYNAYSFDVFHSLYSDDHFIECLKRHIIGINDGNGCETCINEGQV